MRKKCYTHLSAEDRETLSLGLAHGHSLRTMARVLGRAPQHREPRVGAQMPRGATPIAPGTAHTLATVRARQPRRPRKLVDPWLWQYVQTALTEGCSPKQIAGRLRREYPDDRGRQLSTETIYAALYVLNPVDRPYRGWKPSDPYYKVARLMIRAKYNPAYPYHVTMAKHAPYVSTPKSVKGHETRPDGRAIAVDTGYQSNFRYGAQQSFTRSWLMPMHQTDSLPGKHPIAWKFKWGYSIDHHAINTVPKECLIRITKAEDGGIGARGPWEPVRTGFTPGQENEFMIKWLKGEHIKIKV